MKLEFQNTRCIVKKMEKAGKSSEKTTKSATTFRKNKPNSPIVQMNITIFITINYTILTSLTKVKNKPNQTQFKPNSKPIAERPKINANPFNKMICKNFMPLAGQKTKPKQTQTNPIPLAIAIPATLMIDDCLHPAYNDPGNF